jgi:hypothetical protein
MSDTYKQINLKVPLSMYDEILILASKYKIGVNDLLVLTTNSMIVLMKQKTDFISFLNCIEQDEEEIECPVYKRAIALLEIIP